MKTTRDERVIEHEREIDLFNAFENVLCESSIDDLNALKQSLRNVDDIRVIYRVLRDTIDHTIDGIKEMQDDAKAEQDYANAQRYVALCQ